MIETILIAMLAAKVKGYTLRPLFKSWTIYPILGFELIYIFLQATVFLGNYRFIEYANILKSLYLCLFLIPIIKYKKYFSAMIGSIFIFIGSILNDIAIKYNNRKKLI